ncbi:MAG: hypothetical protein MK132_10430 [Lentisphaerales bacterium]|nr:hypothetical protein [Lentisphaerales bacterium]
MSYNFTTPCCDQQLRIENNLSGRKLQCPHCDSKFYIPANPSSGKGFYKLAFTSLIIVIITGIFILPSNSINKAQEEANQLHIIATKSRSILLKSLTLKMEESPKAINALEIFLQAEQLIEEKQYKEAIPFFELAIEKITEIQTIYSDIKVSIQPELTQLKKRIKLLKNQDQFLKAIAIVEKYKNDLKPKDALSLIRILKKELIKAEEKKPTTTPKRPKPATAPPAAKKKLPVKPEKPQAILTPLFEPVVKPLKADKAIPQDIETKELQFSEQESYYGQVLNDIPHGIGRYSYSNGNYYKGSWQSGKFHGKGTYHFSNGDSFEGEWQRGTRQGIGSYKWKNQIILKALWQNGQPSGKAFLLIPDKPKQQLFFKSGRAQSKNKFYDHQSVDIQNLKFRLSKKQQRVYDFSKKISQALNSLHLNDPKILKPDLPPHLFLQSRYFSAFMAEREMEAVEAQIKQSYFSLKRYVLRANKALSPEEENDSIIGEIDGYSIPTAKLGVVLDSSGSMLKYIKPLKEQISNQFPSAAFIEVDSCRLTTFNTAAISEKAANDSTMNAIKYFIDNKGVDSIYWFSDLNGTRSPEAMQELSKWLDESLVALYVRSVGKKPDKDLIKLIEASGGKYLKK